MKKYWDAMTPEMTEEGDNNEVTVGAGYKVRWSYKELYTALVPSLGWYMILIYMYSFL